MSWILDIRFAVRTLGRSRAYTLVAALTLALSIGANTAIFGMADAILNRPFAFPDLRRLVALSATIPRVSAERYKVSPADYVDWIDQNRAFTQLAAYAPWDARLTDPRGSQDVRAYLVSPGFFSLIGITPLHGRAFAEERTDDQRTHVVISSGFWQQRLAGDPAVVGRSVTLNGLAYTIVGVMPTRFDFPASTEIWAPWITSPEQARAERVVGTLEVIGRLKPGVSLSQARAQVRNIAADLERKYAATNAGRGVSVMLLSESADPYAGRYVTVLSAAVVLLLIMACANVANLQLARCAMRRREIALRAALGATRSQIARQLFTEGAVLSVAGACLGVPLASYALVLIKNSIPQLVSRHLPGLAYAELDVRIVGWMALAAVVSGIAFTVPAVLQVSTDRVQEVLQDGGRGIVGSSARRIRSALVIGQIAVALMLLVGAALLFRTFGALSGTNQGFNPEHILTFRVRAPEFQQAEARQVGTFYEERLRRLSELPEIASSAVVSELPALAGTRSSAIVVEGRPAPSPERPLLAELRIASDDYFRTMSIPIIAGRTFTSHDSTEGSPVAVISRVAASRFWPQQDVIGQRLQLVTGRTRTNWLTVVGVVGDVNHFFLDTDIRPMVYLPYRQYPVRALSVVLKPVADAKQAGTAVREAMSSLDRSQPVYTLDSLSRFFADLAGGVGVMATLIGIFAILSLALSTAGIYAMMHYSIAQRTQEIGIRRAMGAQASDVWRMVLGDAFRLVGIGVSIGLPGAWALSRVASKLLAGIVVLDPLASAVAAVLVAATAMLASYFPARRAAHVDPLVAIRAQ